MCPVGRGSGLENRLAVKGSGVRIPNMALYWEWRNWYSSPV